MDVCLLPGDNIALSLIISYHPLHFRIQFKITHLVYIIQIMIYPLLMIAATIWMMVSTCSRSLSSTAIFKSFHMNLASAGVRSFYAALAIWTSFPVPLCLIDSPSHFLPKLPIAIFII